MFKGRVALLIGAVGISLAFATAGCGGGDDSTSAAAGATTTTRSVEATSMSPQRYAVSAQKICLEETGKITEAVEAAIKNGTELKTSTVLPAVEAMHERLAELGAPEGETAEVEAFLSSLQEDLEKAGQKASASTNELSLAFRQSGDLARKDGIPSCALG